MLGDQAAQPNCAPRSPRHPVGKASRRMVDSVGGPFLRAATAAASRHLSLRSRARCVAIAHDLLLVLSRARTTFLWDHTDIILADSKDDDGFVRAASSVHASQIQAVLEELSTEHPDVRPIGLVLVGPSLFVVHREMLHSKLSEPLLEGSLLVAVDRALGTPRFCTASELALFIEQLQLTASALERWLAPDTLPASTLLEIDSTCCAGRLMVCIHGWLLEYPLVYCFLDASVDEGTAGSNTSSCLAGELLRVHRLTARMRTAPNGPRLEAAPPHLVCSFTWPARLAEEVGGDGAALAALARWESCMQQRLACAADVWHDVQLEVRDVAFDSIVL